MAFKKGVSGNISGRPAGAKNKLATPLRETIANFLIENFDQIQDDFANLPARDRARLYCDLLQYGIPKLQAMTLETEFDKLTDEQLDQMIERLKNAGTYD